MKTTILKFAGPLTILAGISLVSVGLPQGAFAQQAGGTTDAGGNDTGGGITGESPLGFDAGVSLERSERTTRDTGTFVGAQAPTVGNFGAVNDPAGGLEAAGGRAGQQGQFFNFFNQLNRANQANTNQRNQIRVPLRLGFAKPTGPAASPRVARQIGSTLETRFAAIARFKSPISVTLDGSTAILTGSVADAETRRIAERLVMLEPGVMKVQNELAIGPEIGPEVLPRPASQ